MTEAIFGLIGVLVGSGISWWQTYWVSKKTDSKNAKYLAIRVVCVLDKYVEDCAEVVKDDGLSYGQRDQEGCLRPQVKSPGAPVFPEDVDWKSIDPDLMYKLLAMPSEVEASDRIIKSSENISVAPDFEDWFIERRYYYSQFGLLACKFSEELSEKYNVPKKIYNDWNPIIDLQREFNTVLERRERRFQMHQHFIQRVFGKK